MTRRSWADVLEYLRRERDALVQGEYTKAANRRVEEIDQLEDSIWQMLDEATPRTYGD